SYDEVHKDFKIEVARKDSPASHSAALYWADGKMLTLEKLGEKDLYWNLMYRYAKDIPDPAKFSQEDIQRLRNFSSATNRSKQAGVSLDFFNVVYDSATRQSTETHIKSVSFLGKSTNAHERIFDQLARVENKIRELAKTDSDVKDFVDTLTQVSSYNWREIRDRGSRSFHSYGIAVDVLPRGWGQKNIYWAWRRDIDPDGWMMLPLDKRWMPPLKVIQAFESEGFIWGGKWPIWDNMHFEYRPELIAYTNQVSD
ncbi:MAG: M15 family metallopeptidase, partial [Treponema sp.]